MGLVCHAEFVIPVHVFFVCFRREQNGFKADHFAEILHKDLNGIFFFNLIFPFYFTQIIAALAVSLGPLAAGLGKGYSSPAIASLQELQELQIRQRGNYTTFTVSDQQASWVASLSLLGK